MNASFGSFLKAFAGRWLMAVSGVLGLPLAMASIYIPNAPLKIIAALGGISGLVYASYQVWRKEREAVIAISDEDDLGIRKVSGRKVDSVLETDDILLVEPAAAIPTTIYLPPNPNLGRRLDIKLESGIGAASAVVDGNGKTIEGREAYVLWSPGQSITLTYTDNGWIIT